MILLSTIKRNFIIFHHRIDQTLWVFIIICIIVSLHLKARDWLHRWPSESNIPLPCRNCLITLQFYGVHRLIDALWNPLTIWVRLPPWKHSNNQVLRSANNYDLYVPKPRLEFCRKSLSYSGPEIWNGIPLYSLCSWSNSLNTMMVLTIMCLLWVDGLDNKQER